MPPHTLDRQVDTAFALVQHGQIAEAESLCRTLAAEHPSQPMIAFLLGAIAMKTDRPAEAARHFLRAIDLDPRIPEFHKTLGDLHLSNHDYDDAINCLEAAERLAPEDPNILLGLAQALKGAGRTEEAISAFEAALAADPGHEPAQLALAKYLHDLGRRDDALAGLGKLADQRDDGTFAVTLADWQLPVIPASLADMRDGRQRYEAAVAALATADAPIPESHILRAGTNFHANYQGVDDRRCQEIIADYYRRNCPALNFRAPDLDKPPGQPISIGFVSANLNNHTVGKLFRGIIAELDRRRFDVSVFAAGQADDEIGRFIQANCETFQMLPSDLAGARQLIAGAALDVLFYTDIGMDPLTYFLAFSRLAPVQCVGWGHGVTTGLPTIDYFLSSVDLQEPEAAAANAHYSETLWRLNLPPVYLYPAQAITAADMPGLPFEDDRTIYCCPQALFKIHPEFDALLAEILRRDQTGVAVFIAGLPGWDEAIRAQWRAAAPELDQRIYFLPRLGQAAFLALLQRADVILDTIYMSGGLSSAEALSLAKPIVTWPNTPLLFARTTYAYYRKIAVADCTAGSAAEYVELAVRLGTDHAFRRALEAKIAADRDKLFKRREVLDELGDLLEAAVAAKKMGAQP